MQLPFDQFVVPSLAHLAILVAGTAVVLALLYAIRPPVTERVVVGFIPWIVVGATLHVFYQFGTTYGAVYPDWAAPLFSAPSVYLTTFLVMGSIWLAATVVGADATASARGDASKWLLTTGLGTAAVLVVLLAWQTTQSPAGPPNLVMPTLGLVMAGVVTFVVYMLIGAWRAYIIAEARVVGALVLFAHLLDGITTAIGVDVLGTSERSQLPDMIMEFAASLPTYQYLGKGWLFVVVKMLLAVVIVVGFADYVAERPSRGNLLFGLVMAVGLGPAVNNLLMFLLGI